MKLNQKDLKKPEKRELIYANVNLLSKLHSDGAREAYIRSLEKHLENFVEELRRRNPELGNLDDFVAWSKADKVLHLLEMGIVLSKEYMDEFVSFLRNDDDTDRLVAAASAFQNADMSELYEDFSETAIEKEAGKSLRLGWIAVIWAGDAAISLGKREKGKKLYMEAIDGIIENLESEGTAAFGEADFDVLERMADIADGLEDESKKKNLLLEAALKAYKDEDKDDSNAYEIAGVYELMGEKGKAMPYYDKAIKKAESEGKIDLAEIIARDSGVSEGENIYAALKEIGKFTYSQQSQQD